MVVLSDRIANLHVSPIRRVTALFAEASTRKELISFGGGGPSLPPPPEVADEIIRRIREDPQGSTAYCGTRGFLELRKLIGEDWVKHDGEEFNPEKEIILTDGATEAIFCAFLSLFNKNDEVVLTNPTYLGYLEAFQLAGARAKRLPVDVKDGYQPSLEILKQVVNKRTKAVVLLSPDNPTGRIIKEDFIKGLLDLAIEYDFWIVNDSTYRDIVYDKPQPKISSMPGAHERVLSVGSFSKEASVPGLRLGYALGPSELIDGIEKVKQYTTLAPNILSQYAVLPFMKNNVKERYLHDYVLPIYRKRRDVMEEAIKQYLPEAGLVRPDGAFYFFVDMRHYLQLMDRDEQDFCNRLLTRKGVIVIPGSYFGDKGIGHVRLTFVSEPEDRIKLGLQRIGEYVFSYAFSM